MLVKTQGLVLNYVKFRESSIIVRIYTADLGIQSFIVNGIRTAKSKSKMALFQPLTLLDLVVYHKKNRQQINRIAEVKCLYPFHHIPFDFKKTSIALFLTEVLSKTLKEEEANVALFEFLNTSLQFFDQQTEHYEHFHLQFLLKLSQYLGFAPSSGAEIFLQIAEHKKIATMDIDSLSTHFDNFIQQPFDFAGIVDAHSRSQLIDYLWEFYKLHIPNLDSLQSLEVLREMNR
jgi:DNA repair protein RecO (recombination protein O)